LWQKNSKIKKFFAACRHQQLSSKKVVHELFEILHTPLMEADIARSLENILPAIRKPHCKTVLSWRLIFPDSLKICSIKRANFTVKLLLALLLWRPDPFGISLRLIFEKPWRIYSL
jgi:hypothetical protein